MKKYIAVTIFSFFFLCLFSSPTLANNELSRLIQQKERAEILKERVSNLSDLAERTGRDDIFLIANDLLLSVKNISRKIKNKIYVQRQNKDKDAIKEDIARQQERLNEEARERYIKNPLTADPKKTPLANKDLSNNCLDK